MGNGGRVSNGGSCIRLSEVRSSSLLCPNLKSKQPSAHSRGQQFSLSITIMSTPPYLKRSDSSQSPTDDSLSAKKRRKGATRLSCAECRRQASIRNQVDGDLPSLPIGSSCVAIVTYPVEAARNEAVALSALMVRAHICALRGIISLYD